VNLDSLSPPRSLCDPVCCAFSKHHPPGNYVIEAISDSLKPMAGWVLRWLSTVRTRLCQRIDLLLEFIVLRHQLAVLQQKGTRRPRFRPGERLFWVFLSHWWVNWQPRAEIGISFWLRSRHYAVAMILIKSSGSDMIFIGFTPSFRKISLDVTPQVAAAK
jgi:hypothetical protein